MPIGSPRTPPGLGVNGTTSFAIGAQAGGNNASAKAQTSAIAQGSLDWTPWIIVSIAAIYLFWAVILQHQRVKDSIQPSNIAANVHNFLVVGISAMLFLVLGKIAFTKLAAWGVPGSASIAQVFQAS